MTTNCVSFKMIVAFCKNRGIGYQNKIPWYSKIDLRHFSKLTSGNKKNSIIMGRKTWDSLPKKPLKNRVNIILSRSKNSINLDGFDSTYVFDSIDLIKEFCKESNFEENWIIGGHSLYNDFLNCDDLKKLHVTYIPANYTCDVFFPSIPSRFVEEEKEVVRENNIDMEFLTYISK